MQILVEESGLQNSEGPEVMLYDEVVIFGPGGFQRRIAGADRRVRTRIGIG